MGPKIARGGLRRTHVLGGCDNCRRRHMKCDLVQPTCLTCQAAGIECPGYSTSIQWASGGKSSARAERSGTRQYLYSERSRWLMSKQLTDQVSSQSLDTFLAKLDAWSEDTQTTNSKVLELGPFSVIDFNQAARTTNVSLPIDSTSEVVDIGGSTCDGAASSQDPAIPVTDTLQWSDLFDLDFSNWLDSNSHVFDLEPDTGQDGNQTSGHVSDEVIRESVPEMFDTMGIAMPVSLTDSDLKKNAQTLIKHFNDRVVGAVCAMPFNLNPPLKILNVANAVQALANLTYLDIQVSYASAANLFHILACSAYHKGSSPSGEAVSNSHYWTCLSEESENKAKFYLKRSLQTETRGDGKAKYKDQLMALHSAFTYAIMVGQQKEARHYMIDAERLLRMRGLAKRRISRRVRLLHHVYAWCRVVGESTYVLHDSKTPSNTSLSREELCTDYEVLHATHNIRLDEFLRMDQTGTQELDIEEEKEPQTGLRDIHLEDPRDHADTLYPHIYGIPETWLSLLSRTTRLANVIEMHKMNSGELDANTQKSFDKQASRLEDMMWSFAVRTSRFPDSPEESVPPNFYMLRALNSALVVYYYRRIRNVNSMILQSHVDKIVDALQNLGAALDRLNIYNPGTAWPAFIGGCEASPGPQREFLLKWVETASWKTSVQTYKSARNVMIEIWARKDQLDTSPRSITSGSATSASSQSGVSWIDISRERKEWVILC